MYTPKHLRDFVLKTEKFIFVYQKEMKTVCITNFKLKTTEWFSVKDSKDAGHLLKSCYNFN